MRSNRRAVHTVVNVREAVQMLANGGRGGSVRKRGAVSLERLNTSLVVTRSARLRSAYVTINVSGVSLERVSGVGFVTLVSHLRHGLVVVVVSNQGAVKRAVDGEIGVYAKSH